MIRPDVEVAIEALVITGVSSVDAPRVAQALTTNLERLLSGLPSHASVEAFDASRVDGGAFVLERDGKPETLGANLADVVYRSLPWR